MVLVPPQRTFAVLAKFAALATFPVSGLKALPLHSQWTPTGGVGCGGTPGGINLAQDGDTLSFLLGWMVLEAVSGVARRVLASDLAATFANESGTGAAKVGVNKGVGRHWCKLDTSGGGGGNRRRKVRPSHAHPQPEMVPGATRTQAERWRLPPSVVVVGQARRG